MVASGVLRSWRGVESILQALTDKDTGNAKPEDPVWGEIPPGGKQSLKQDLDVFV